MTCLRAAAAAVLLGCLAVARAGAAEPRGGAANRPDGDPPGHGTQRLGQVATALAHSQFNGDACLAGIEVLAFQALEPKEPAQDSFSFMFRSPMLNKMRWDARICLLEAAGAEDPRCSGEWESTQGKADGPVQCIRGRPADSGEALTVALNHGLPKAPVDGRRMALRLVPKSGKGMARDPKLKGKLVWLLESREQCHALDGMTLAHLYKGPCGKLGWPEK